MACSEELCSFALPCAFIEISIIKRNRECAQLFRRKARNQGRRNRGVQPATQICSNRNISAKPNARGIQQQLKELVCGTFCGARRIVLLPLIARLPIPPCLKV